MSANRIKETRTTGIIFAWTAFAGIIILFFACEKLDIKREIIIETGTISDTTANSAIITGEILDLGESEISEYGHCWSINENPTTALETKTTQVKRNSRGVFEDTLSPLMPETRYYVRAYATDAQGTVYGSQIEFSTLKEENMGTFKDSRDEQVYHGQTLFIIYLIILATVSMRQKKQIIMQPTEFYTTGLQP
jgi:hypothetical protein